MTDVATEPATPTEPRSRRGTSLKGFSAPTVLLLGIVIIPGSLTFLFNSWSEPDDAAYVRMAFAAVAGSTIAILSVVGLLVDRIIRRASVSTIAIFAAIALFIVPLQVSAIQIQADLLVARLGS